MFFEQHGLVKPWMLMFGCLALSLIKPDPAFGQLSVFDDGFESGSTCRWSNSSPPNLNCPPAFPGIILAAANDIDEITLAWFAAQDDFTPANLISYQIHISEVPDFEPGPDTLALSIVGDTQGVVPGLLLDTTYHLLILAEDGDGATSLERDTSTVTTPAFPVVLGDTPLQQAIDLNLGEPTFVTGTTLTFLRTAEAIPPHPGALLAGQTGFGGYLRAVESVTVNPGEIIVETQAASLADAVDQIGISSSLLLSDISTVAQAETSFVEDLAITRFRSPIRSDSNPDGWRAPLLFAEQTDPLLRPDGTRRQTIETDNVDLDVEVTFEPKLQLSGSWSLVGGIESGEAVARGTLGLSARATYDFNGAASFEPPPVQLLRRTWFAYYQIGPVPVLQRITLDVQASISANASTEISASATANASATVEIGVRYEPSSNTWEPVSSVSFARSMSSHLDVKGAVEAEVRIVPKITVESYETLAADLTIEPSLNGNIAVASTAAPQCAPLELTNFDFTLGVDCFAGADFTAFNLNYSLVDNLRVCGPLSYPLFDLPQIELSSSGTGSTNDPLRVEAQVTGGTNNLFSSNSATWDVLPASGALSVTSTSPPAVEFTCGSDSLYTLGLSGHGRLGDAARRCFEFEHMCSDTCMTGTWVDSFNFVWELVQVGSSITGVVTFNSCGTSRDVTGTFDGSNVSLTAVGAAGECCDFTYTGTITECSSGSGSWVQFPGAAACTGSGTWSMTRTLSASQPPLALPPLQVTPARAASIP